MNTEQRQVYNRFGEEAAMSNRVIDEYHLLLEIAVFYLTWGMLVFVLTLGKSSGDARNWTYTGMIIMLVIELSLKTQEVSFPEWFLPRVTEHEMVWLLHTLFPAFMNGCRCIGSFVYKDLTAEMYRKIQNLEQMNAVMKETIQEMARNMNAGAGASGKASIRVPAPVVRREGGEDAGEGNQTAVAGPSPMAATLNAQMQAMNAQKTSSSNYGLLVMIVGYVSHAHAPPWSWLLLVVWDCPRASCLVSHVILLLVLACAACLACCQVHCPVPLLPVVDIRGSGVVADVLAGRHSRPCLWALGCRKGGGGEFDAGACAVPTSPLCKERNVGQELCDV